MKDIQRKNGTKPQGKDSSKEQRGKDGKPITWNNKPSGNKQGKQQSVNNFKPYKTGQGNKKDRQFEEAADTILKSESNPLQYYTKYSKFAEDAATIPFSLPVGTPFEFTVDNLTTKWAVPGIMRIVFSPTVGVARDYTSAINRSSTKFFTYLRSNQKASGPYDHQDITMMELSLDSAYMFHAMCCRIYETMNAVTPVNEYYTRALIASQGVSFTSIQSNMQDFRSWINQYAYNLGQFAMPKGITLFDRHRWMCSNYFTDGKSSKAQTYIFVPRGFWKYDNTVETGSQLTLVPYASQSSSSTAGTLYTYEQLVEMGNSLLNAFAGDEDFQYISGDLYNFYGGDMYQVPYLEEKDLLVPLYDETVLSQIENAVILGDFAQSPVISQNPTVNNGAIIFNPQFKASGIIHGTPINFHWDSPTPGEIIEATRLSAVISPKVDASGNEVELLACGTELVNWLDVYQINPATGSPRFNSIASQSIAISDDTHTSVVSGLTDILHLAQFDWAPLVMVFEAATSGASLGAYTFRGLTWDIDNFQIIADNYLEQIHNACLWSLFEVGNNRTDLGARKE